MESCFDTGGRVPFGAADALASAATRRAAAKAGAT